MFATFHCLQVTLCAEQLAPFATAPRKWTCCRATRRSREMLGWTPDTPLETMAEEMVTADIKEAR
jgi:GDP-D-mannose dehydratase